MKTLILYILSIFLLFSANISEGIEEVDIGVICTYAKAGDIEKTISLFKRHGLDYTDKAVWHSVKCTGGEDSTLFEELSNDGGKIVATKDLMRKILAASDLETLHKILNCKDRDGDTLMDYIDLQIEICTSENAKKDIEAYKALFQRAGALNSSQTKEGPCLE